MDLDADGILVHVTRARNSRNPKLLTTKMSRSSPPSFSLASPKIFSFRMEARAGKAILDTKIPMYKGCACSSKHLVGDSAFPCQGFEV